MLEPLDDRRPVWKSRGACHVIAPQAPQSIRHQYLLWRGLLYMEAFLTQVREEGLAVQAADVARLSPLVDKHINFQGRYSFALSEAVAHGELRPLRNPDERSEDGEW
jgi:Tn3 transposase DDE domain